MKVKLKRAGSQGCLRYFLELVGVAPIAAGFLLASATAAPLRSQDPLAPGKTVENSIERAQFVWRGHNYCQYTAGWHGPGWYWCGYSSRAGQGWGGRANWHGDSRAEENPEQRIITRPGGGSDRK
jgi:hypothetical protein